MEHSRLEEYRKGIDECDDTIISALKKRFEITRQVGMYKAEHKLAPLDTSREEAQDIKLKE